VTATAGASLNLTTGNISTAGNDSYGILTTAGLTNLTTVGNVSTSGSNSFGVQAVGPAVTVVAGNVTTAGAADTRAYEYDRGYSQTGPIPAQCRSGSCGTCWVGVLGGAGKLSEVERLEARRLNECGYLDNAEGTPYIRLACMARASGNVTIVIPPWNGFVGTGRP
jgi:ferredoxin